MEAKVLDAGIVFDKHPVVFEVFYNLEKLIIRIELGIPEKELIVTFERPRGFRCLDEGDLLNFWGSQEMTDNWFFEITKGGWIDNEDQGGGFISKSMGYREFLITGTDMCVSVIDAEPPTFEVINIKT